MKTKSLFTTFFFLMLISVSFSCGKGDGSGDVVDTLLPDLTATWTNTADAGDDYFFNVPLESQGKASASFDGVENNPGTAHFSGSYTNSKINFTFSDGPKKGQKYTGIIKGTAPNATMTLTIPAGTLNDHPTLQQHQ